MKYLPSALLIIALHLASISCSEASEEVSSPPGYDLAKPTVYKMPSVLEEISGIAFSHGNPEMMYAEQDEEGKLFYFKPGDTEVKHTKFSKRGDYEDVAIMNNWVIMLRSDGDFFTFPLSEIQNKDAGQVTEQDGLLPAGEYESLYADENSNTLYVLCKNCPGDKDAQGISGHIFSVGTDGKLARQHDFSISDPTPPSEEKKSKKNRIKPSGMAKNPLTGQWFILSSVNKTLLITDAQWKTISTHPLNPSVFSQPEGIAFDNSGNLYIANERGNAELGTVLLFKYTKK